MDLTIKQLGQIDFTDLTSLKVKIEKHWPFLLSCPVMSCRIYITTCLVVVVVVVVMLKTPSLISNRSLN